MRNDSKGPTLAFGRRYVYGNEYGPRSQNSSTNWEVQMTLLWGSNNMSMPIGESYGKQSNTYLMTGTDADLDHGYRSQQGHTQPRASSPHRGRVHLRYAVAYNVVKIRCSTPPLLVHPHTRPNNVASWHSCLEGQGSPGPSKSLS